MKIEVPFGGEVDVKPRLEARYRSSLPETRITRNYIILACVPDYHAAT